MHNALFLALFLVPVAVQANPINKLCRASTTVQKMYAEGSAPAASLKAHCFDLGRMAGATEEGMTFRDKARDGVPAELLAKADHQVALAQEVRAYCVDSSADDSGSSGVLQKIESLAGPASVNAEIQRATCE